MILRRATLGLILCLLLAAQAHAQSALEPTRSDGWPGLPVVHLNGSEQRPIPIFRDSPRDDILVELTAGEGEAPFPFTINLEADVRLRRGMATVGYAFAVLEPEVAEAFLQWDRDQRPSNVEGRIVWLGEGQSAITATLFLMDGVTLVGAKGQDVLDQVTLLDFSVGGRKSLSDKLHVGAELSRLVKFGDQYGSIFDGFSTQAGENTMVHAGLGYMPMENLALDLSSYYQESDSASQGESGRGLRIASEWSPGESVVLGAAFAYYREDVPEEGGVFRTSPLEGQITQLQAFFHVDENDRFVLGVSAHRNDSAGSAKYFTPDGIQLPAEDSTVFEISITGDL